MTRASLTLEQEEQQLLTQQRRGYAWLRFAGELEEGFVEHRRQRIQRRLLLIGGTAILFQLIYVGLDLMLLPLAVSLMSLPLRSLAILGVILAVLYCRLPDRPPRAVLRVYSGAFALNGICVVLIIHLSWAQGLAMPYDGLFLILLFGYVLLGISFRAVSLVCWGFCALFLGIGVWFGDARAILSYQGLFLLCANLIGSGGAYLQEHGQRGAWLNLRLLDLARQRAERDDARKLQLLAAASHDLRQPLNAMGLYAQHLVERSETPEVRQVSSRLAVSVEQLSRLLQSLLDYTRLTLPGGVPVKPQAFALRPLLERLVAETHGEVQAEGPLISLHSDADVWVCSDPLLLERMVRNLLSNALRHADAQAIRVSVRRQDDQVLLAVEDDGRGLDAAEQAQVFEEFRQLHNPGRNAERGLGLGLAIVRQLAARLAHPLQLRSQRGQGACFSLLLPAAVAEVASSPTIAARMHGRLLLLEDDAASREALRGLLERWGCDVAACATLGEALLAVAEAPPHLLISDYRLGTEEDGLRALERLREEAGRMLPALLITAEVTPELQERCMPAHVTLLGKPLLPARLRQALAVMLPAG
ncbi:Signal transduction histidine kinase [Pseudomonas cuatrocienegasensis]|uniref:histidine kinase n=1 Tax=Pseudomonas cuatrocienegasensis TaxID=543360 RepID=A0ABY1BAA2_9PSED|nr:MULTISPECIES: hybrid sensor histidine kinase/response regulator [Pseudomonas]SEQ36665.1 Signal transduction histidine kinase [Pseudomonas cuatrocienegasensis]